MSTRKNSDNKIQTVRLTEDTSSNNSVENSSQNNTWDSFFLSDVKVTDDFMENRETTPNTDNPKPDQYL